MRAFPARTRISSLWVAAGLVVLNLLNYADRHLLAGASPLLQSVPGYSDLQLGAVVSWFYFVYMWAAPLIGWVGDRFSRRLLVLLCSALWSALLIVAAAAPRVGSFTVAYAASALAMAGFGIFGISLLSDCVPATARSRAISLFLLSMTVGRAAGFPLGAHLAYLYGWQAPFRICGIVGLLLTLAFTFIFFCSNAEEEQPAPSPLKHPSFDFLALLGNGEYLVAVFALSMHTFATSALNTWMPIFLCRQSLYAGGAAATLLGSAILSCGVAGTWLGGMLGDRFLSARSRTLFLIAAVGLALAIPCIAASLATTHIVVVPGVFATQFFLTLALVPLNTALIASIPSHMRSVGIGLGLFLIHILGDVPAPRLVGSIAHYHGPAVGAGLICTSLVVGALLLMVGRHRLHTMTQEKSIGVFPG